MKTLQPKLLSSDDCESLDIPAVRKIYREHVNPGLENILFSFGSGEVLIDQAEGVWMTTADGRKILDVSGGIGVLTLGHNHPRILAVRQRYLQNKKMEVHKTIFSRYQAALSYNLAQLLPGDLDYPFFCNSGAEAVEGAIKAAYKYHGGKRHHILHADISFHGKLLGSGGLTNTTENTFKFPTISGIRSFAYQDIRSVKKQVSELRRADGGSDIYALIIEPFNAISLSAVSPEFLQKIRRICTDEGICLILDEVYCGWCKTGNYFRFLDSGIIPDILTTSKSFGGGKASISAYIVRKPVLIKAYGNMANATLHTTTYNGFGEECATALEAINVMVEENYPEKSRRLEELVREKGNLLTGRYPDQIEEIRGAGALHGIFLKQNQGMLSTLLQKLPVKMLNDKQIVKKVVVAAVTDRLFRQHNIYTYFNNNSDVAIMFAPSLVINREEAEKFFLAMDEIFQRGLNKVVAGFIKNKLLKIIK